MFRGQSAASVDFLQFSCSLFAMSPFSFHSVKRTPPLGLKKLEIMSKFQKQVFTEAKDNFMKSYKISM